LRYTAGEFGESGLGGLGRLCVFLVAPARLCRQESQSPKVGFPKVLGAYRITAGLVEELLIECSAGGCSACTGILGVRPRYVGRDLRDELAIASVC
jgi:hypothetical protein